jgi:hypothetical protein
VGNRAKRKDPLVRRLAHTHQNPRVRTTREKLTSKYKQTVREIVKRCVL